MTGLPSAPVNLGKNKPFWVRRSQAFTLIELLVASAVLALLLAMLLQVTSHTLQASKVATQRLDASQAARQIFDTLSGDIASRVRQGSTVLIQPNGASVSLALLTLSRGPTASGRPARFLAVNYQLEDNQLKRLYEGVAWGERNLLDAAQSAASSETGAVLAPAILQFAVLALLEDGRTVVNLQNGIALPALTTPPAWRVTSPALYQGETVPSGWSALVTAEASAAPTSPRVQALLVAVAAIDEQTLALLNPDQRTLFTSPATADPVKEWEAKLVSSELPAAARSAIRFSSKVIPLP